MEIVYSTQRQKLKTGQRFQNPRFFSGVPEGATSAVVHGDFPEIVAAYKAAKLEVTVAGSEKTAAPADASSQTDAAAKRSRATGEN
jgi:hypothetical protein